MGWDIVAIGTNHKLPIDNPIETAKAIASVLDGKICVGYYVNWEFDKDKNTIRHINEWLNWQEIMLLDTGRVGHNSRLEIKNECARRIYAQLGSIDRVEFVGEYSEECFCYDIFSEPYDLYEIESGVPYTDTRYFKEIVEFSRRFGGRWFAFVESFTEPYEGKNKTSIDDFRHQIYSQLKAYGCDCAYYFSDQGYSEALYEAINRSSADWIKFMESRQYIEDPDEYIIYSVQDYLNGKLLNIHDSVICIIDDFSDYK